MDSCCIGQSLSDECHKTTYNRYNGLKSAESFDKEILDILLLRSGVNSISNVCLHHEHIFLKKYPEKQTSCCDPFNNHKRKTKKRKASGNHHFYSLLKIARGKLNFISDNACS